MSAAGCLREATARTFQDPNTAFIRHLEYVVDERRGGLPMEGVLSVILNKGQTPDGPRAEAMGQALDEGLDDGLTFLGRWGILDSDEVRQRASGLSGEIVGGVAQAAANYPDLAAAKRLQGPLAEVLGGDSLEDQAVRVLVAASFVGPHVVKRLTALDWRNIEVLQGQVNGVTSDAYRLARFCGSLRPLIEVLITGSSADDSADAAEKLCAAGPLVVKLGQGFPAMAKSMGGNAEFFDRLGGKLQEGVAPPSKEQERQIAGSLPEGLAYEGVVSSASIAHVLRTQGTSGEYLATKVVRPGINEDLADNVASFQIFIGVLGDYVKAHAGDTELGERLDGLQGFVPFGLHILETDARQELDLMSEQAAQQRAVKAFGSLPGIKVPAVRAEYSDKDHLTMEYIEGKKVAELPAKPARLRNLLAFALQSWRSKLLHSDLHGGNLKSTEDGSVIVYDWARPVDLSLRFITNMARFVWAAKRRNPQSIAKAYRRIQSTDHRQCTEEEVEHVARDVIQSLDARGASKSLGKSQIIQNLIMAMGVRHQSTLDTRYASLLKTSAAYASVLKAELNKPEYEMGRHAILFDALLGAFRDVYITNRKKKQL